MKKINTLSLICGSILASIAAPATAEVITFNELTTPNLTFVNPVNSGGFTFSGDQNASSQLGVWGQNDAANMDIGGAAIFHNFGGTITTVTKNGGGMFNLFSVDLADVYNNATGGNVELTFTDLIGTTSQIVTLDQLIGGQTFVFNRNALTSFTMQGITTQGQWLQFDNVAVDVGAVPEPATWIMMLLGFAAIGATMRRQRTTAQIKFA